MIFACKYFGGSSPHHDLCQCIIKLKMLIAIGGGGRVGGPVPRSDSKDNKTQINVASCINNGNDKLFSR